MLDEFNVEALGIVALTQALPKKLTKQMNKDVQKVVYKKYDIILHFLQFAVVAHSQSSVAVGTKEIIDVGRWRLGSSELGHSVLPARVENSGASRPALWACMDVHQGGSAWLHLFRYSMDD